MLLNILQHAGWPPPHRSRPYVRRAAVETLGLNLNFPELLSAPQDKALLLYASIAFQSPFKNLTTEPDCELHGGGPQGLVCNCFPVPISPQDDSGEYFKSTFRSTSEAQSTPSTSRVLYGTDGQKAHEKMLNITNY